jgi:DNA-binding transcriptional ArsR family regulator
MFLWVMLRDSRQDRVFRALADPTRRGLIDRLGERERSVSELTELFDISQPAVSQHLKVLREANLVTERKDGRNRIYRLNTKPLVLAQRWLDGHIEFWAGGMTRLGEHLRKKHGGPKAKV